ncbi:MAG: tetratricopeptide repeat protein [Blastocatellia bacterium]
MTIEKTPPDIPYAGLKPYSEENAHFFFGRERAQESIIANLRAKRLTLVFGASGVGKSSLLGAGVAHKLRSVAQKNLDEKGKPEFAVAMFSTWRDDPIAGLTACVQEAVREALDDQTLEPIPQPSSLADTFRLWTELVGGDLLIILDQFEEYFLYHKDQEDESGFAYEIARMVKRPDLRVNFLISIRDDAYSKIERLKENILNVFDNSLEIEHLDRASARSAIVKPIDQYNRFYAAGKQRISIEPELVEEVLWQLRPGQIFLVDGGLGGLSKTDDTTDTEAGIEAPFLQLVMTRLWKEEMAAGSTTLRRATLDGLQGADKIVQSHLTELLEKLSENEQTMVARIFHYLVTPSGGKIAMSASDLAESAELDRDELIQMLNKLSGVGSRILRVFAPPGAVAESRYEVFHDVLAPAILAWRRAHDQKLRDRQAEEDKQRATEKARDEERAKAAGRRRVLLIVIAILSILTLAVIAIASIQLKAIAEKQRAEADERRDEAVRAKKYAFQAADASSQTLARLYSIVTGGGDPKQAGKNLNSVLDKLNETLESYRRDGNRAGEGIMLNNVAGIHRVIGESYSRSGHYQQAEPYYQKAQDYYQQAQTLLENSLGPDHPEVATSLNDLAVIYVEQGKYKAAEWPLTQVLSILEKVVEQPDDLNLAIPVRKLATCYNAQGKYNEAEPLYNRALEIRRNKLPANSPDLAQSLNDLAWLYYERGNYAQAEPLFNESLAIWKINKDEDSESDSALSLNGLGAIYRKRGNYDEANAYFVQAAELHEKPKDKDNLLIADDIENLGLLDEDQGNYDHAEMLFKKALGIWDTSLAKEHPIRASGLSNLASLYYRQRRYADAETAFKEALQIQEVALENSPDLAQTLSGLARLYTDLGRYVEAENRFEQALAIQAKVIPDHPDLIDTLTHYATLMRKTNREIEAEQLEQRAKQIQDLRKTKNLDN